MKEKEKLVIAQQQVSNLLQLIQDNPYEQYLNLRLTSVYYELQRQISLYS
jgi:hypothetical protein